MYVVPSGSDRQTDRETQLLSEASTILDDICTYFENLQFKFHAEVPVHKQAVQGLCTLRLIQQQEYLVLTVPVLHVRNQHFQHLQQLHKHTLVNTPKSPAPPQIYTCQYTDILFVDYWV